MKKCIENLNSCNSNNNTLESGTKVLTLEQALKELELEQAQVQAQNIARILTGVKKGNNMLAIIMGTEVYGVNSYTGSQLGLLKEATTSIA